jgi:hypothetical protein
VVSAARECLVAYGRKTSDLARCAKLLRKCRSLAISDASRTAIDEDLAQVDGIRKAKDDDERAIKLVDQAILLAKSGQPVKGRRMLEQALATCADGELRQQIAVLIRRLDEANATAAPQHNAGGMPEPVARFIGLAVVIGVIALIAWLADSCSSTPSHNSGSYTPSASPSDQEATPRPSYDSYTPSASPSNQQATPPPSYSYSGLSSRIDSGKARAKMLESELTQMRRDLESMSIRINRYKREIAEYEQQASSGSNANRSMYQQTLDNYNALVGQYNPLLNNYNAKYAEYGREIDSVNDMVRRFNSGER